MNASADIELYLHNSNDWGNNENYKFTNKGVNPENDSEIIWEYTLKSNTGLTDGDFYFRLRYSDYNNDLGPNWCASSGNNYTYQWKNDNEYNGKWETYSITHESKVNEYNFWGTSSAFCIKQSEIKASEYKITVYANKGYKYHVKVEIVSMPATVSGVGFSTFSCDRCLDFTNVSGLTAYKATINVNKILLTPVSGKVAAGTGLLIAGTSNDIPVVPTSEGQEITDNNLVGTPTSTVISSENLGSDYYYFLSGNTPETVGFYALDKNKSYTSAAGKAYLRVPTPLASESQGARVAWIFADDNATGINTIQNKQNNDVLYDLQGRVAKTAKAGLYIKNGKKVMVK